MPKTSIPTKPGTKFGGGLYAGRFFIGAQAFALIVSPKAEGDIAPMPYGSLENVKGALSYSDGVANTKAMSKDGSELAKKIAALRIGGFKDWHLPSRLESLVAFGELRSEFERDWYWTSTQRASSAEYAWIQGFGDGYQYGCRKSGGYRARAVRTIAI